MAVPNYEKIMAPALRVFADGQEHRVSELVQILPEVFQLSPEDLQELLPSGTQTKWQNRVQWACYYLYRAGLIQRTRKGIYRITDEGCNVAKEPPTVIDSNFLMKFPCFREFKNASGTGGKITPPDDITGGNEDLTPLEQIEAAHARILSELKKEILDLVRKMDPYRFERLVLDLLLAMGYGGSRQEAGQVTKRSNDEGIDGLINEDRLGLDCIYVQAKRWENSVGRPEIQHFVGALAGKHAAKGIFITTSDFSSGAVEFARSISQRVILINGVRLAELMIEHNIGTSVSHSYEIKRIDSDYFEEI
jgi:restriction system protein